MPDAPAPGNLLTRKIGPLPGWQWGALVVVGAGAFILYRRYQAAQAAANGTASSSGSSTSPLDQTGVSAGPPPPVVIVEQPTQPATTGTTTTTTPTTPKTVPTPKPVSPPTPVPHAINWASFPKFIAGLSPQGGTLRSFASIENGRVVGGNVRNGAPVYALVQSKQYGPIWEQGFNPKSLPNGTRVATLPQFSNLIVSGKAA